MINAIFVLLLVLCGPAQATPVIVQGPDDRVTSQSMVEQLQSASRGAAPPVGAPPITSIALALIKEFEGWVANFYNDPAGYCTIGYGHLIALARCAVADLSKWSPPLTEGEGENLLEADTRSARIAIQQLLRRSISQDQFGALVSFAFNVGVGNFSRSTLLRLVNLGEYELAGAEFGRWVKAGGKVLPGLTLRRACEHLLFSGRAQLTPNGRFASGQCSSSLGAAPQSTQLIDVADGE